MQDGNPIAHQRTTYPRHSQPAMPSLPTSSPPESKPELEHTSTSTSEVEQTLTELESDPDREYENQLGLPDYHDRYDIYESSPPPVDANINCDKLNNEGEFFHFKEDLQS
jgi:hypothetical protein